MKILFLGDIVGKQGRDALPSLLTDEYLATLNFVIANGENATHGKGIGHEHYLYLRSCGIDVVTLGNHYANQKDLFNWIDSEPNLIRPLNVHKSIKGHGSHLFHCGDKMIRVTNLLGRVYMNNNVSNPFDELQALVDKHDCDLHIVDFHAESTGEKMALAKAFDGKVTAVFGTHTHVQTADERVLPLGTAFISDAGMCGPYNGILGVSAEDVIFMTWIGLPSKFTMIENDDVTVQGVEITIEEKSNKVTTIKRVSLLKQD